MKTYTVVFVIHTDRGQAFQRNTELAYVPQREQQIQFGAKGLLYKIEQTTHIIDLDVVTCAVRRVDHFCLAKDLLADGWQLVDPAQDVNT